ncbi:MAG: hypothetical protein ACRCZW_05625 [Lactobacillaceae bacterium]
MKDKEIFNDIEYFIDNCTEQNIDIPNYKYNMTFTKKGIIYFDSTELHKLTKKIIEDKALGKNFSGGAEKYLINRIMNLIAEYKFVKEKSTEYTSLKIVEDLKREKEPYLFFIPIYGIKVDSVYPRKYKNIALCSEKYREQKIKSFGKLSDENEKLFGIGKNKDNSTFIFIKLYANNDQTAKELSLSYANDFILMLHSIYSNIDSTFNIGIGNESDSNSLVDVLYLKNNHEIYLSTSTKNNIFNYPPIQLSSNDTDNIITKVFFSILNKKINNEKIKSTDIENKLYIALTSIGRSTIENNSEQSLLDLMTAVESLIEEKNFSQNLTDQICERCAELLGEDSKSKLCIYKEMKLLYNKRSEIIHGNKQSKITISDLRYLREIGSKLCNLFINNIEEFKTITDWNKYFLELRFKQN